MEGLILKTAPYADNHQITTLFTPDLGRISIFSESMAVLKPLNKVDVVVRMGKSDLYYLQEVRFLRHFCYKESRQLLAVQEILGALPYLPAKELYPLLEMALTALEFIPEAYVILLFQVKVLLFEGMLDESYFDESEKEMLQPLKEMKRISELLDLSIDPLLLPRLTSKLKALYQ